MNRIDRLTAILLQLQGGKQTAGSLAQRFEVSRRTIFRDIQALCEMGIPIATELGAGGGYTLPDDYSLPPLALTLHEALLLRLALSSLARLAETPYKQARESLLAKVQTLLPRHEEEALEQLQQRLSLDVPSRPFVAPFLDRLLECARDEQWVAVSYRSERGVSQQTLLPFRLYGNAGLWYCEAFSFERREMRVYRVDRVLELRAVPAPQNERPDPSMAHVDDAFPEVRVRLTQRGVLRLERERYLASRVEQSGDGDATLRLRLRPADYEWLLSILLGLGADATVLEPPELRERLREAGAEIAQRYQEW